MLLGANIPAVSQEFFDKIQNAFRPIGVTTETTINEVMFDAGRQEVVEWVKHQVRRQIITGSTDAIVKP